MPLPLTTTRDDFEYWLVAMDATLDKFLSDVPPQFQGRLDFSVNALDLVEQLLLARYPDTNSMLLPDQLRAVNEFACYIGETFRKAMKCKWDIRLDDPKFAFHGLPILVGGTLGSMAECPLTLATAATDRRTGRYLRTILENNLN